MAGTRGHSSGRRKITSGVLFSFRARHSAVAHEVTAGIDIRFLPLICHVCVNTGSAGSMTSHNPPADCRCCRCIRPAAST